jgi:hypothetical protein
VVELGDARRVEPDLDARGGTAHVDGERSGCPRRGPGRA